MDERNAAGFATAVDLDAPATGSEPAEVAIPANADVASASDSEYEAVGGGAAESQELSQFSFGDLSQSQGIW